MGVGGSVGWGWPGPQTTTPTPSGFLSNGLIKRF